MLHFIQTHKLHPRKFQTRGIAMCLAVLLIFSTALLVPSHCDAAINLIILNHYSMDLKIGDERYLIAVATNGKTPTFSSSDSSVASVNTYGCITAKKAGTAKITAKVRGAEASCRVRVEKTTIKLNRTCVTLDNGYSVLLTADVSTGHEVTWKSSRTSVATVDDTGKVCAQKPGSATITATADKTSVTCQVTVRQPTVTLSKTSASLYRGGTLSLTVRSSSRSEPKWKSNRSSVATVDENGLVTALKHGSATISVTVDGVTKSCSLTVKQPTVTFSVTSLELKVGQKKKTSVSVSSGNTPVFSSSNTNVATVEEDGTITAVEAGKAYIYAVEDGVKARISVVVKETK
jgi:uncharacterized protein YjdB